MRFIFFRELYELYIKRVIVINICCKKRLYVNIIDMYVYDFGILMLGLEEWLKCEECLLIF